MFLLYVSILTTYVYVNHTHLVFEEARRGLWIPGSGIIAVSCYMGARNELRSLARVVVSALKQSAISPALIMLLFIHLFIYF